MGERSRSRNRRAASLSPVRRPLSHSRGRQPLPRRRIPSPLRHHPPRDNWPRSVSPIRKRPSQSRSCGPYRRQPSPSPRSPPGAQSWSHSQERRDRGSLAEDHHDSGGKAHTVYRDNLDLDENGCEPGIVTKVIDGQPNRNGDPTWLAEIYVPRPPPQRPGTLCVRGPLRFDRTLADTDAQRLARAHRKGGYKEVQEIRNLLRVEAR